MAESKKNIAGQLLGWSFLIVAIIITVVLASFSVKDLQESKKAEKTLESLKELRIAIDKYYILTQKYPNLTLEGAKDNLRLLDYIDKNGKKISFAEIYGKNSIDKTPKSDSFNESNNIYDKNSENSIKNGGWNYDFSGNTGEIHANLPQNIYYQGIEWSEY